MLKIYGTMRCKDCVACVEEFKKRGMEFEFLDFDESLDHIKAFLKLRDSLEIFAAPKEAGGIGIPCVGKEDGSWTLDWESCLEEK